MSVLISPNYHHCPFPTLRDALSMTCCLAITGFSRKGHRYSQRGGCVDSDTSSVFSEWKRLPLILFAL